VFKLCSI